MLAQTNDRFPVFVEFESGSRIEQNYLTAADDELPETAIVLHSGERLIVPTEQVIFEDSTRGSAKIGIGGMSFEGVSTQDEFVFCRVKDLLPEQWCSPQFDGLMKLPKRVVSRVVMNGAQVWPEILDDDSGALSVAASKNN